MIDRTHDLPVVRQCQLLALARSTAYYVAEPTSPEDLALMRRIDELHLEHPFAGSRMLRDMLKLEGHQIGRKRVSRLMKKMRIEALYRKPNLSRRHAAHPIYRYLLRDLKIDRPNQVWATDITYIPMRRGFVYLIAVIDWYSRKVLSWRLSNTLTTDFCLDAVREAITRMAARRSSTPIKVASSPVANSRNCSRTTKSGSAWTARAAGATTCLSNDSGKASSTRRSI